MTVYNIITIIMKAEAYKGSVATSFMSYKTMERTFAYINLALFLPLTIQICFYFLCLRSTLNICLSQALQSTKRQINTFFAFLLVSYMLRSLYAIGISFNIYT